MFVEPPPVVGQAAGQSGVEAPGLEDDLEEDDDTIRESLHTAMTALAAQETSDAQVGHACFALQLVLLSCSSCTWFAGECALAGEWFLVLALGSCTWFLALVCTWFLLLVCRRVCVRARAICACVYACLCVSSCFAGCMFSHLLDLASALTRLLVSSRRLDFF